MKKGFTLSEVLVALAIVGVISVMVIPESSRRIYNSVYISTLQSSVAQILDALNEAKAEQRINDLAYLYEDRQEGQTAEQLFMIDKMNAVGDCGDSPDGCFGSSYTTLNKTALNNFTSGYNAYVSIKNGASIAISFPEGDVDDEDSVGEILVDANGAKAPNVYGRDAFKLSLRGDSSVGAYGEVTSSETIESALAKCKSGTTHNYMCYYYLSQNDWKNDY